MEKKQPVTPSHDSGGRKVQNPAVTVKSNMSQVPGSGASDALHASLGHRDAYLPSDNHVVTHTTRIEPVGARYEPRGEFGHVATAPAMGRMDGIGMPPNRSGGNALPGKPAGKKGGNALGKAMGKVGKNANMKTAKSNR